MIRFQPKLYTEMYFNKPLTCTKFQSNRSIFLQVIAKNAKCVKRRKKLKKLFRNFAHSLTCGASVDLIWLNSGKWSQLHGCKNYILSLPLNILTVRHDSFLGRTIHYRVSWSYCSRKVDQMQAHEILFEGFKLHCTVYWNIFKVLHHHSNSNDGFLGE